MKKLKKMIASPVTTIHPILVDADPDVLVDDAAVVYVQLFLIGRPQLQLLPFRQEALQH